MADHNDEGPAVLIVDDDEIFRKRLCRAFANRGWECRDAATAGEAIAAAGQFSPDLAIVDLRMPGPSGIELVRRLCALDSTIAIVILTGYGSIATALEAVRAGAGDYLTKPVDVDQLLAAYDRLRRAPEPVRAPDSVPSLARVEWEHIQRVLSDCSGNVSRAARLLGLHRRSLQRKLSKYPPAR